MSEKKPPAKARDYILTAYVEQLIDEGLDFDGDDARTKILNHTDFDNLRSTYQRLANGISLEERETFIRCVKTTLKPDCPLL
jgi:hypothetical protein